MRCRGLTKLVLLELRLSCWLSLRGWCVVGGHSMNCRGLGMRLCTLLMLRVLRVLLPLLVKFLRGCCMLRVLLLLLW
jgi:hypothetical protein